MKENPPGAAGAPAPFFSICIPQHGRTSFLLVALQSLVEQVFQDFEVCISDDRSPDGRSAEVLGFLERAGLRHRFEVRPQNARYDANLRAAVALASGRYCLLMGNDDALAGPAALARLHDVIVRAGTCSVVIPDFEDYHSGVPARRIRATAVYSGTVGTAVRHFRNFSFVSGIVLDRVAAQRFATQRWDGAEMYQTYVGCSIIAGGGPLLELAESLVRKDIVVPGEIVDSIRRRERLVPCPIVERRIPLVDLGRLVCDAVIPQTPHDRRSRVAIEVLLQVIRYPYPYWLMQYRSIQSWKFALGVALGMRPRNSSLGIQLRLVHRCTLAANYALMSILALLLPVQLFRGMQPLLYRLAKAVSGRGQRLPV